MKNGSQRSYHGRFPQITSRIPRELKDVLIQRQNEKGVTLSEIIEEAIRNGVNAPGNPSGPASNDDHGQQRVENPSGAIDTENTIYDRGFSDGFKNGSNHTKKDIKNRLNKDSQKINDKINGLIKQHIKNQKDEYRCYNCGYTQDSPFENCPKCGSSNSWDDHDGGSLLTHFSDFHLHIPILSDILFGEEIREEEGRRETGEGINFTGGTKSNNQSKKEGDHYQCHNCDFTQGSSFETCPECGSNNSWD